MKLDERQISRATRRKMARTAKRTAKKRARKRKLKSNRVKSPEQLKSAAQKMAKDYVSKKMAGGKKYSELSLGAKEQLARKLSQKKGLVQKITRKMLPIAKQKDKERIKRKRASKRQDRRSKPSLFFENYIIDEGIDPLTIASIVAITGGAVAITATLAKKLHDVLNRNVDFKVAKTYELIKRKYPSIFVMIRDQRFGRGKLQKMVRDMEDEIPGLKKKTFMDNITNIIDQLMAHHNWATSSDTSGKLNPDRFQRESVNEYVGPTYKTANEIKKEWKKQYPNDKFTFKKVRAKGSDWLLVLSPKGVELERYQHVPKTGWIEMNENKDNEEDIKSLKYMLDISQQLSSKSMFFKNRGGKKKYIKMILHKLKKLGVNM